MTLADKVFIFPHHIEFLRNGQNFWPVAPIPGVRECPLCGAAVSNVQAHIEWHEALVKRVGNPPEIKVKA